MLCVVDDTGDMVDRPRQKAYEGFSVSGSSWPMVGLLMKQLDCTACCFWTAWRRDHAACVTAPTRGPRCDVSTGNVPTSFGANSPLAETMEDAIGRAEDVVFITNGIDWQKQDVLYRGEVDLGDALCDWLADNPTHDLILGAADDQEKLPRDRRRRSNMLVGLVRTYRPTRDDCSVPTTFPSAAKFTAYASVLRNPSRLVTDGIVVDRLVRIVVPHGDREESKSLKLADDGTVRLARAIYEHAMEDGLTLEIGFRLAGDWARPPCWRYVMRANDVETSGRCTVTSSTGETVLQTCTFRVPASALASRHLRATFSVAPADVPWAASVFPEHHTLLQSLDRLASAERCRKPLSMRLAPLGGQTPTLREISLQAAND